MIGFDGSGDLIRVSFSFFFGGGRWFSRRYSTSIRSWPWCCWWSAPVHIKIQFPAILNDRTGYFFSSFHCELPDLRDLFFFLVVEANNLTRKTKTARCMRKIYVFTVEIVSFRRCINMRRLCALTKIKAYYRGWIAYSLFVDRILY